MNCMIKIFLVLSAITCFYIKVDNACGATDEEYNALVKQYESVKSDRDNILFQTKRLLDERKDTAQIREAMDLLKKEKDNIVAEKASLEKNIQELKSQLSRLEEEKRLAESERENFKDMYQKLEQGSEVKRLKDELSRMEGENNKKLIDLAKQFEEKMSSLIKENNYLNRDLTLNKKLGEKLAVYKKKAEVELKELNERLKNLDKKHKEAAKKNSRLEKEVVNLPSKFSEIARQNKTLVKETSQMHYNLGVFYTKEREYSRAISEFLKAIEINPKDAYAHFNLGYIYAEYLVNREEAIKHFRMYLRLASGDDSDVDWVKKYLLTWETYEGKKTIK